MSSSGLLKENRDREFDLSRRVLLQATGLSAVALAWPRALSAAPSERGAEGSIGPVDFRFSPRWLQTLICLPDDPDKALVGKEGQLLFNWGVNVADSSDRAETRRFAIVLHPDLAGGTEWRSQTTVSPRVPIVQTLKSADGIEVLEEVFVVAPKLGETAAPVRLAQMGTTYLMYGLSKPESPCSSAFSNGVMGGTPGKPIHFQAAVTPGAAVTVVYGLCERQYTKPGAHLLVLSAEGGETKTVDPVKDFGVNTAAIYKLNARDVNHDGKIDIFIVSPSQPDDNLHRRATVLNALWIFTGQVPPDEAIISGRADELAYAAFPAILQPPRREVIIINLRNTTQVAKNCQPLLRMRSWYPVVWDEAADSVSLGDGTRIFGSSPITLSQTGENGDYLAQMQPVDIPPGESREVAFTIERHLTKTAGGLNANQARALRVVAASWWEQYDLPYTVIEAPDRGIQDVLESCIRNIWQARELKVGGPAFEVGPTYYRGLWVADGSFLLETVALLGRGRDARAGMDYLLSLQKPDGGFEVLPHHWKENGFVLWASTRHAMLMQDKEWLRSHWPALRCVMANIHNLREEASQDPQALHYRLLPPGFIDGGLGYIGGPEFSNTLMTLAGMHAVIGAAHWLGEEEDAAAWQREYDDFYAVFRAACARETLKDSHGNAYVPVMMANAGHYSPQKAQWAFCMAVYPGQIFGRDDSLVAGQLAMLHDSEVEGLVCDTGGLKYGLWVYFASLLAHAQLWVGQSHEAARSLYAFVNHACPTRVWVEEQMPVGQGAAVMGDMPHNWSSAEFIRLVTHLIELDRGSELHLLEGFPREWSGPGMVTRLNGAQTPFGVLSLEVRVSEDGRSAQVKMGKLLGDRPSRVVLHLKGLTGRNENIELPTDRDVAHTEIIDA